MNIASLVVRVAPGQREALTRELLEIPGVEVHGAAPDGGRLIVTVEDGEGYSMMDSILAVNVNKRVHGVTLAYEYTGDGIEMQEQEA
ncbi:chaperone NapD [Nitrogeniibacter mangrovi]|uniref:Chaperone NapD n=1 Tax=Nitrogeniibacter mangrovi TaxID=2016596 RepID=A0A6C1B6X2_9RHOO|nr:chaperone NapD [Nitrogeniibacter mangrovi]QID19451.1 chaperone NapD [Nitrogeniibacter mangrovi]